MATGLYRTALPPDRLQASYARVEAAARAIVENDPTLPLFSRDWERLTDGARSRYRAMASAALAAAAVTAD